MIHQNEIVMLTLGCCVAVFALMRLSQLRRVPSYRILMVSFGCLLCAWIATVVEGFLWGDLLNAVEHGLQMLAYVLLAFWVWSVFVREDKESPSP